MKNVRAVLVAALGVALPATASAQKPDDKAEKKKPAPPPAGDKAGSGDGQSVQMEEDDTPPSDMEGTSENPDAPKLGDETTTVGPAAPKAVRTGYPIEEVLRPITLPAVTSEVGVDLRSTFSSIDTNVGIHARYGITRQWQLGVRYGVGGIFDSPVTAAAETKFNTGKALGLDVTYLVFDWLAAQVTVPVYIKPYAMALELGAPMKFRFGDKLAIVALDDIVDIRLTKFIPSLTDERVNAAGAAAVESGTTTTKANIHFRGGVEYQVSPQLAVKGDFVQTVPTAKSQDAFAPSSDPFGLEVLGQYSPSPKMDLIGRMGIDDFTSTKSTFGLLFAVQYRI
jgi:hypothetical protein